MKERDTMSYQEIAKNMIDRLPESQMNKVVNILCIPAPLPPANKDHGLVGNYADRRECHITPDWLLIYRIDGNALYLDRTGTHADLFDM